MSMMRQMVINVPAKDYDRYAAMIDAVLSAESCSDAISRQAALDAICEQECNMPIKHCTLYSGHCRTTKALIDLPSVHAEPRTGHWKISKIPKGEIVYCSECGFGKYLNEDRKYNYCPNCGAKMEADNA